MQIYAKGIDRHPAGAPGDVPNPCLARNLRRSGRIPVLELSEGDVILRRAR